MKYRVLVCVCVCVCVCARGVWYKKVRSCLWGRRVSFPMTETSLVFVSLVLTQRSGKDADNCTGQGFHEW
jgi:hypothetical protein